MATKTIRQQIIDKFKDMFIGLKINNKKVNVFFNDPYAIEEDELPALCINISNELIVSQTVGYPRTQERTLEVELTCVYQATNNLNEIIEEFTYLVEDLVSGTEESILLNTTGDIVQNSKIENIEFREFSEIATKTAGSIINMSVLYICVENELKATI